MSLILKNTTVRMLMAMTLSIALITVLIENVIVKDTSTLIQVHNQTKTELIESLFQASVTESLADKDYAQVQQNIIKISRQFEQIRSIRVLNPEQKEVAFIGSPINNPFEKSQEVQFPINGYNQLLGFVNYRTHFKSLNTLTHEIESLYVIATAIWALLFITIAALNYRHIRSVRTLNVYCQSIAENRGRPKLVSNKISDDELKLLAKTLEQLLRDVNHNNNALKNEKARLRTILNAMSSGIALVAPNGNVQYVNRGFEELFKLGTDFAKDRHIDDLITYHSLIQSRQRIQPQDNSSPYNRIELKSGTILRQSLIPIITETTTVGQLWVFEDITDNEEMKNRLEFLASHDTLTGLYNRRNYSKTLNQFGMIALQQNKQVALILIDLDDFKDINDTHGHHAGDTALKRLSTVMSNLADPSDWVGRLGGDEFVVVKLVDNEDDAQKFVSSIQHSLSNNLLKFDGNPYVINVSVGYSVYPDLSPNLSSLSADADVAMYESKAKGKNCSTAFNPDSEHLQKLNQQALWKERITHALNEYLFEVHFQAIFDTNSNIQAAEALVRYPNPESAGYYYSPGDFLPIAEMSNQINAIDKFVVAKSIQYLSEYPQLGLIAINLSERSIRDKNFSKFIALQLSQYQINANQIIIELSESIIVNNKESAIDFINSVSQLGCSVGMDNFGRHYSSLNHLNEINLDFLKIDGTYVHDLHLDDAKQLFVTNIIELAKRKGVRTVAEFVESSEELQALKTTDVDFVQGYHLQKPCNLDDFLTKLSQISTTKVVNA